ncbi:MAG: hypothetical protein HC836_34780 [Richelia sp. RM2_1_2]|nr:hypothetical protein [Richelia sp. RM2_1_2]
MRLPCYFLTKLLLEITGFNNNYKKVFQLDYRYDSVHSSSVINSCIIPKKNQLNSLDKLRHKASIEVAELIYENILLQQEIVKINKQHDEIDKVFKLIAKSQQYVNQQEIYKNALLDLNKVLSKADKLNNVTFDYISEILINTKLKTNEISVFSNNVTDKYLSIEAQHLQLKEDYQHLKDVSSNYDSLVKIDK